MVAGHIAETGPSTSWCTASALARPDASSTRCRAAMIVARPWVRQCRGTSSTDPPKNRALSSRVCFVRVLIRVRDASDEPGSLNAMCPSVPMPRICRSTPPASAMLSSYAAQAAGRSSARPSGPCTAPGARSTRDANSALDDVAVPLRVVRGQAHVLVEHEGPGPRERRAPPCAGATSSSYTASGDEPVASPSTASGLARTSPSTASAASRASSPEGAITTSISSPRSSFPPEHSGADRRDRNVASARAGPAPPA